MPRVHAVIARAAKKSRSCASCFKPIEVGDPVYSWTRRNWPTTYQHQACGFPKPSQLYSRKTAVIEDLLGEADFSFDDALTEDDEPGGTHEIDTAHVESVLGDIADVSENVADEYEESADNLPEGLQQGYQAEAMRDIAERLRDWADGLRSVDYDTTIELRSLEDDEDLVDWRDEMQDLLDNAVNAVSEAAQDAMVDMPEYEG